MHLSFIIDLSKEREVNEMLKKLAYKIVFKDLCKCNLFIGKYDSRNSKSDFMYGISTVMENIAYSISDKIGDKFSDNFIKNMIASEGGE